MLIKCYTDKHDVDEDLRAIQFHGGCWWDGNTVGITCRFMRDAPTHISGAVASKK